ncbi:hypothetical protein RSAG8_05413, partial [Rhizoctonia solani AG-8 WAC10335]
MYDTLDQRPQQSYQHRPSSPVPDKNSDTDDLPQPSSDMPGQYPIDPSEPEPVRAGEEDYSDRMETDTDITTQLEGTQLDRSLLTKRRTEWNTLESRERQALKDPVGTFKPLSTIPFA